MLLFEKFVVSSFLGLILALDRAECDFNARYAVNTLDNRINLFFVLRERFLLPFDLAVS